VRGVALRVFTRRDALKLALAANAAWLGAFLLGPWTGGWSGPQMLTNAVPIEELGLGIRFTNFLRSYGITTIGKLLAVLDGTDEQSRSILATDIHIARMLRYPSVQTLIKARLAAFRKSGPLPFARLTRLETEVLDLATEGRSYNDISRRLRINKNVIDAQLKSMMQKMRGLCAPFAA
jgi:Bacterial regulatory proteins, luxR family